MAPELDSERFRRLAHANGTAEERVGKVLVSIRKSPPRPGKEAWAFIGRTRSGDLTRRLFQDGSDFTEFCALMCRDTICEPEYYAPFWEILNQERRSTNALKRAERAQKSAAAPISVSWMTRGKYAYLALQLLARRIVDATGLPRTAIGLLATVAGGAVAFIGTHLLAHTVTVAAIIAAAVAALLLIVAVALLLWHTDDELHAAVSEILNAIRAVHVSRTTAESREPQRDVQTSLCMDRDSMIFRIIESDAHRQPSEVSSAQLDAVLPSWVERKAGEFGDYGNLVRLLSKRDAARQ